MNHFSSWPGLTRPSTFFLRVGTKTWMPGSADKFTQSARLDCGPGMTSLKKVPDIVGCISSQALKIPDLVAANEAEPQITFPRRGAPRDKA